VPGSQATIGRHGGAEANEAHESKYFMILAELLTLPIEYRRRLLTDVERLT
jgi:hypothetical protein